MVPVHRTWQVSAVVLLAVFWAVNWPMMKIGLTVVEPWTFRALLVVVGGIGCLAAAAALGEPVSLVRSDLRPLLWFSLFQGVLWNGFSGFGIALVEAGRAAVLAFTMPVWATLLAILFLGEAITRRRIIGLLTGMGALFLLIVPDLEAMGSRLLGSGLMIAGAISWATATVIVKASDWTRGALALCGWQFLLGGVPLTIAAIVLGEPSTLQNLDLGAGLAVAYSALIPMVFCQAVWFTMVRRLPTSLASMATLLVPPLGVIFANLMLGEAVGQIEIAALLLVIFALGLVLPGFNWRASLHPPPGSRPE